MSSQVYSVPGQTEGRRRAFLERKSIDLSYKLSLTCRDNVNYYKSVHHLIPTRENKEHRGNFQNKSVSSAFKCKSTFNFQEHFVVNWDDKVSPFIRFEITLPLLCFLLDHVTNKHWRIWNSMINLWIDS